MRMLNHRRERPSPLGKDKFTGTVRAPTCIAQGAAQRKIPPVCTGGISFFSQPGISC